MPGVDKAPMTPMSVHALDRASMQWVKLEPTGTLPMSRSGHTATVVGGKLWVFGGEGADRRLKNDTHCLDLEVRVSCVACGCRVT
jgi:N-acetylneuraminic acid mutarotase